MARGEESSAASLSISGPRMSAVAHGVEHVLDSLKLNAPSRIQRETDRVTGSCSFFKKRAPLVILSERAERACSEGPAFHPPPRPSAHLPICPRERCFSDLNPPPLLPARARFVLAAALVC